MFSRKLFSSSKHTRRFYSSGSVVPDEDDKTVRSEAVVFPPEGKNSPGQITTDASHATAGRSYSIPTTTQSLPKQGSLDRASDPLGLTLLHEPTEPHVADIIFVHGLGGSSRLSWSKNKDPRLFWPQEWLPSDHDVGKARIFTFGYNAFFHSTSQSSAMGVSDFAKNLLYDLSYGRGPSGTSFHIGSVPVVFVTHSMGGLVFKKAFLEGSADDHYKSIVEAIKAVIFLSTPHRGADLASILNKVLSTTVLISQKQYVSDLIRNGPFVRGINEQFRHSAPKLQIFSFYETLKTSIGFKSALILDQETATLGYSGEVSRSLNADHHGVCKFDSPQDSNYRVVLSALKSLMSSYTIDESRASSSELERLRALLSVSDSIDHDLDLFWARRAQMTCNWVLKRPEIDSLISSTSKSELQWIYGRPGRGKSVLASFLINHLRGEGSAVQHFFFRAGNETKRSISTLLRSLAYQAADQIPAYRRALRKFSDGGYKLKESDWRAMWEKLFVSILFRMDFLPTLYWVIDGLDECDSPQLVFEMLTGICTSKSAIKCLVTSRWSPTLSAIHGRLSPRVCSGALSMDEDKTDFRLYTSEQLEYLSWSPAIKQEIMGRILENTNDNFLWLTMALQEIKDCHTERDVRQCLAELPPGMEDLYQRMEEAICQIRRPSDKRLCRHILLWAMYTRQAVSVDELGALLQPEHGQLLDVAHTMGKLCGHFVVLEGGNRIALLHNSAREYLTTTSALPFSLEATGAHRELLEKCLSAFMDKAFRGKLTPENLRLVEYRATSWPHHLQAVKHTGDFDEYLDTLLARFFSQAHVLLWIQTLATMGQLRVLLEASHALLSYIHPSRRLGVTRDPEMPGSENLELLESWAQDLLKIPGKFGSILSRDPQSIFTSVPSFCPTTSIIHKSFASSAFSAISVRGRPSEWDDCLAGVSVESGQLATLVASSGRYLAVADGVGTVTLWDSTTFQVTQRLQHSERVSAMCFDTSGDQLATYGSHTTKIWAPQTGQPTHLISNIPDTAALCLSFVDKDKALLTGSDRRCLLRYNLTSDPSATWILMDSSLLNDVGPVNGTNMNSPSALAISPDGSMIAAAYRRFPLAIWSISPPKIIKRLSRKILHDCPSTPLPFASKVAWHPLGESLLGLFLDGYAFKYDLVNGTLEEQAPDWGRMPDDIQCSPDGEVYAIQGVGGNIRLFDYESSTMIHQITSSDGVTGAFAFSQDGRRFFQLRGDSCTVWEPNSLLRLSAAGDQAINSQSSPAESIELSDIASKSFVDDLPPISLVSPAPKGPLMCVGDEDGLIWLFDSTAGSKTEVGRTATGMSIEHVAWNDQSDRLIYSEISGRLTLLSLSLIDGAWTCRRIRKFKPKMAEGGIRQLLFSTDSSKLLVAFKDSAQVWSLESGTLEHTHSVGLSSPMWTNHPQSADQIICVNSSHIGVCHWTPDGSANIRAFSRPQRNLEDDPIPIIRLPPMSPDLVSDTAPDNSDEVEEEVQQIRNTHFPGYILLTVSRRTASRLVSSRFEVLDTTKFVSTDGYFTDDAYALNIPSEILKEAETPLDVLPNERLVFFDKSLRLCTWHLRSSKGLDDITRHFSIPRDWLSSRSLHLAHINASGTIFCPRRDGIAMIDSTAASAW